MLVRTSGQAVSSSEDVDDHALVRDSDSQPLLGDVVCRVLTEGCLPHVGSALPPSLQASSDPQHGAVVVAVSLQRPLGVTRIAPLDLERLAAPLEQLLRMAQPAGEEDRCRPTAGTAPPAGRCRRVASRACWSVEVVTRARGPASRHHDQPWGSERRA